MVAALSEENRMGTDHRQITIEKLHLERDPRNLDVDAVVRFQIALVEGLCPGGQGLDLDLQRCGDCRVRGCNGPASAAAT
jgi:hypothetical protein